mgnify:CR=1 FL=1
MQELQTTNLLQFEFVLRIVLASICGMFIGWERERRLKSAGLRTHMLVALASSLMMVISKYAFLDIVFLSSVQVDASRVAAGVVQAIGFLGAGVIFVKKDNIVGVTTAAGLWATVGIGLTIGSGLYVLGISCTALIILIQLIVHRGEHKSFSTNNGSIQINLTKNNLSINDAREKLEAMGLILKNISLAKNTDNQIILSASIISVGDVSTTEVVNNLQSMDFIDMIEIYSLD